MRFLTAAVIAVRILECGRRKIGRNARKLGLQALQIALALDLREFLFHEPREFRGRTQLREPGS